MRFWTPLIVVIASSLGCGDDAPADADGTSTTSTSTSSTGGPAASTSTGGEETGPDDTTGTADTTTGSTSTGSSSGSESGEPPEVGGLDFEPILIDDPVVRVTALTFLPGSSDFMLLSKDGVVAHYAMDGDAATRQGSFTLPDVHTPSDCGAISLVFDPDFDENRLLYVGLCKSGYYSGIFRMELSEDFEYDEVVATMAEVIEVGTPQATNPWHNVGSIGFDPDGTMWAVFGDKTVGTSAADLTNNLGSLIRIIPDRSPGGSGYEPAPDNPFFGHATNSPDVWAHGLRSPWTALRDTAGRYWVGEVGSDNWEEVNVITEAGQNLGWPEHEGACDADDCTAFIDPVTTWPHGPHPYIEDDPDVTAANARVGWVGAAYDPGDDDRYDGLLTDRVLFGDSCLGYVRAIEIDDAGSVVFDEYLAHLMAPTDWAQGPDGYLYVVTYGGCGSGSIDNDNPPRVEMFRVVPSTR